MRIIKRLLAVCAVFAITATLCSCSAVSRLEEQAIVSAVGIDRGEKEKYKVTVQVFQSMGAGSASPIDPSKTNTILASCEAQSIDGAMQELKTILGRQVNTGHTKYIVLGRELLSEQTGDALGYFIASEQTYLGTPVLTTDKKAEDILKVQLVNDIETAIAVQNIIDTAVDNGKAVRTDLLTCANAITDKMPIALPILTATKPPEGEKSGGESDSQSQSEATEEQKLLFRGTAVIKDGMPIIELNEKETLGVAWLMGTADTLSLPIKTDNGQYTVALTLAKQTRELVRDGGKYTLTFFIEGAVRITESSQSDVDYDVAKKSAERELTKICGYGITALRENGNYDILGIKKLALAMFPFGKINYDNIFTDCEVVVNVNLHSDR